VTADSVNVSVMLHGAVRQRGLVGRAARARRLSAAAHDSTVNGDSWTNDQGS
jgi:hypothetical protein